MSLGVGLMSGTSLDGIDAALVEISDSPRKPRLRLIAFKTYPFSGKLKKRILACSQPNRITAGDICRLHFDLGEVFAATVRKIVKRAGIPLRKIDFVGSHGQTICHLRRRGTLQLGEPSVIAERCGLTTVADFRPRDIAAGGEGAPIAPYLHYLLFRSEREHRAVHNLGGISNLTFIPRGAGRDRVIGFDTGPGNMLIDGLLREVTGHKKFYDHGGRIAWNGSVSLRLLRELMKHPFVLKKPPKTCGREEFGRRFVRKVMRRGRLLRLRKEDLIATATAFTAASLAENYRRFIFPQGIPREIVFAGGGIHNKTLLQMIRTELTGIKISTFEDHKLNIPSDAVESVLFALLAHETLKGRPTNLPLVTGARRPVVMGKIIPGRYQVLT